MVGICNILMSDTGRNSAFCLWHVNHQAGSVFMCPG